MKVTHLKTKDVTDRLFLILKFNLNAVKVRYKHTLSPLCVCVGVCVCVRVSECHSSHFI